MHPFDMKLSSTFAYGALFLMIHQLFTFLVNDISICRRSICVICSSTMNFSSDVSLAVIYQK